MQLEHRRCPPRFCLFCLFSDRVSLVTMQRLGTVAKPLLLEFRNAWSRQIRALYSLQFMTKCPKSLHCLQSLSFLPHVLQIPAPWPILDIQTVAHKCGIRSECFTHSRQLLAQSLANSSEFSLLCAEVLKYRLEKSKIAVLPSNT